jgi:hypothetical protein
VGALARSGELTGRIGVFLLRFGLAAPLGGGNRTINGGDSASNGSLGFKLNISVCRPFRLAVP